MARSRFREDLKKGFGALIHPGKDSQGSYSIGGALRLYYSVSIIPFILFLIVGSVLYGSYATATNCLSASGQIANISCGPARYFTIFDGFIGSLAPLIGVVASVFLADVLFLLIIPPIAMFIDSLIYQLIGKFFLRAFKKDIHSTFTAVMFGALPALVLYWLLFIPAVSYVMLPIITVWGFIVAIIALSNQQKINRTEAFVVYLVTLFLVFLIAIVFSSAILTSFAPQLFYGPVLP